MTALLFIVGAWAISSTVMQVLTFILLRDALHTLIAQGSARRQWVEKEHHDK